MPEEIYNKTSQNYINKSKLETFLKKVFEIMNIDSNNIYNHNIILTKDEKIPEVDDNKLNQINSLELDFIQV